MERMLWEAEVGYDSENGSPHTQADLIRPLLHLLQEGSGRGSRVLEHGCGNSGLADRLNRQGYEVVGMDPTASGYDAAQ